jgi:FAD/FMN-containing dehydrogenase
VGLVAPTDRPRLAGFGQHAAAVGELVTSLYAVGSAGVRLAPASDPGPGVADFQAAVPKLDARSLTHVVSVDASARVALVQGHCPMARLADTLIPRGLVPPNPASPGARTVGGAIARTAAGPFSFREGPFSDSVTALEVLTPDGMVVAAERDGARAELFHSVLGGHGATGFIVSAQVALKEAKPFVATAAEEFGSATALAAALARIAADGTWRGETVHAIEAVHRAPGDCVVSVGRLVGDAEAPSIAVEPSGYSGPGPAYLDTLRDGCHDLLRLGDYIRRWDSDEFWRSFDYGLGHRAVRALWPRRLRTARVYARVDAVLEAPLPRGTVELAARWRPGAPRVFREAMVPLANLAAFLERLAQLAPGVPSWLCPVRATGADLWVYCGVWGPGATRHAGHHHAAENAIDRAVAELGGQTVRTRP